MEYLSTILGLFTAASILATVAASFYGVRQKTIITTLRESNDAYKERNEQLEKQIDTMLTDHKTQINGLEGRLKVLEGIKTPPIKPLMQLIEQNELQSQRRHEELMLAMSTRLRSKKNEPR